MPTGAGIDPDFDFDFDFDRDNLAAMLPDRDGLATQWPSPTSYSYSYSYSSPSLLPPSRTCLPRLIKVRHTVQAQAAKVSAIG